jgi:hypothetical protein
MQVSLPLLGQPPTLIFSQYLDSPHVQLEFDRYDCICSLNRNNQFFVSIIPSAVNSLEISILLLIYFLLFHMKKAPLKVTVARVSTLHLRRLCQFNLFLIFSLNCLIDDDNF